MVLTEINTGLNILKYLKVIYPFVEHFTKQIDRPAFDTWREPEKRLEKLQSEIQLLLEKYPGLQSKLTENERHSSISGVKETFKSYVFAVDENKLEYLRNALINGSYGDYTFELREHFFKTIANIQPLDILILKYLVDISPNLSAYLNKFKEDQTFMPTELDLENYRSPLEIENRGFNKTIQNAFQEVPLMQLKLALDRLRTQCLTTTPDIGHYDMWSPYCQCVPTDIAQSFLSFVSDPRNSLL